jgi:hypothetical protein
MDFTFIRHEQALADKGQSMDGHIALRMQGIEERNEVPPDLPQDAVNITRLFELVIQRPDIARGLPRR